MKYIFIILMTSFLSTFSTSLIAQSIKITIPQKVIQPSDSLRFHVAYEPANNAIATLLMISTSEEGEIWEKRFPILSKAFDIAIATPAQMTKGRYDLKFVVLQNTFNVMGKVLAPGGLNKLKATLVVPGGGFAEKDVVVLPDSSFVFGDILFEGDGLLSFSTKKAEEGVLNIMIEAARDSAIKEIKTFYDVVFVGESHPSSYYKNKPVPPGSLQIGPEADAFMLPVVTVEATLKSKAQTYNDKYSTGLFKSMDERIYDLSDEISYQNVLQYLQGRVAGLQIYNGGFNTSASWRRQPVTFYLDENRVDITTISTIPINDIAIVKAYPPPFFGNFGGSGGGIAVYTKRGRGDMKFGKTTFKVTGYAPLSTSFGIESEKF